MEGQGVAAPTFQPVGVPGPYTQRLFILGRLAAKWLGEEDSNLHRRLQRPLSCHWTIPQEGGRGGAAPSPKNYDRHP